MRMAVIGSKGLPAKFGGTQVAVENIYKRLIDKGWEITVYSRLYYSDIKEKKFQYKGINVVNVNGIKSKRLDTLSHSFISTIQACNQNFDIIVFHGFIPAIFAIIPRLFRKKTVMHSHGVSFLVSEKLIQKWTIYDRLILNITRFLTSRYLNAVTTVSLSELAITQKLYRKSKIQYIPNGLNFITISDLPDILLPEPYFLFVGRILEGKGLETLIKAFNLFHSDHLNYKLLIVGENNSTSKYFKQLQYYSKQNSNIIFVGGKYGNELITYYKKAYAVVIPSVYESFSLVLFEALFYNGKIICSDIDQFNLTVSGYVSFFKNGSQNDLANKMVQFSENPHLLITLQESAKNFDYTIYSWDCVADEYNQFYLKVINNH